MLTVCTDTGAKVREPIYKLSHERLSELDREHIGAEDVSLVTLKCAVMNLKLDDTVTKQRVYVDGGASRLLLEIIAIRSLGLIHEITGTYSVNAFHHIADNN